MLNCDVLFCFTVMCCILLDCVMFTYCDLVVRVSSIGIDPRELLAGDNDVIPFHVFR